MATPNEMAFPQERAEALFARYVERHVRDGVAPDLEEWCAEEPELLAPMRELVSAYEGVSALLGRQRGSPSLIEAAAQVVHSARSPDADTGAETARWRSSALIAPGRVLVGRYRIVSLLGSGGLGVVWRALDLKLRVEVALKALRPELVGNPRVNELVRREVRAAREVVSPNVCRIFDLVETEGEELVSMELVDGETLLDWLGTRGPLELDEAMELASQLLAGLGAVHEAGLVHRDVKPENVMVTRTGRVVVMDFGLARAAAESGVSGTPAYMAPEQAAGESADARADIYSVGVLLAEMINPEGIGDPDSRRSVWEAVRQDPPALPESSWQPVLERALAARPEDRFPSARALARALEKRTLMASSDGPISPYPGLSSFGESDADYFFGREAEIEALWTKLEQAPRLLAVVGASGAGKSSFLRAGVVATRPEGWKALVVTPGRSPFLALGSVLARALPADATVAEQMLRFSEPGVAQDLVGRWAAEAAGALLVVDQFEEVFTQCADDERANFAALLARLPLETNVHVVLGMRDDFLYRCHEHPELAPILSDLTLLGPPAGSALRRAMVQPALKCGYRFEDAELVDEMLGEVAGERGALPLLAFAASRLWERRDHEAGLLTREVFRDLGGVVGALARHAEAALERVGHDRLATVRELFRNLVTAQGTRSVRDHAELLSVFSTEEHRAVGETIDTLVDARLLVSYEAEVERNWEILERELDEPTRPTAEWRRIEIVHESLLTQWPRLVRWRMQDQEGAQMRDQLRQAARLWSERGRPDDLLWTGTSFREYELWRERYAGKMSEGENAFSRAMENADQRRRWQRRGALGVVLLVAAVVTTIMTALWRTSVHQERRAKAEARRAEASELLARGRLEDDPTGSAVIAYTLASLERADEPASRLFALETLSARPIATIAHTVEDPRGSEILSLDFSPDGRWLASGDRSGQITLLSSEGGLPTVLDRQEGETRYVRFGPDSKRLVARSWPSHGLQIWSVPDGHLVRSLPTEGPVDFRVPQGSGHLFTFTGTSGGTSIQGWPWKGGEPVDYGVAGIDVAQWSRYVNSWNIEVDPAGTRLAYAPVPTTDEGIKRAHEVYVQPLRRGGNEPAELVGRHAAPVGGVAFSPDGGTLASADFDGEVRIWNLDSGSGRPQLTLRHPGGIVRYVRFDPSGSRLAVTSLSGHTALWTLDDASSAGPLILRHNSSAFLNDAAFAPQGGWLATARTDGIELWPIRRYPLGLEGHEKEIMGIAGLADGSLLSASSDGTLRQWTLTPSGSANHRIVFDLGDEGLQGVRVDPSGRRALVASSTGTYWLVPLDGGSPRPLGPGGAYLSDFRTPLNFDLNERVAVVALARIDRVAETLRVWDLASGDSEIHAPGVGRIRDFAVTADDRLVLAGDDGIFLWHLGGHRVEVLLSDRPGPISLSRDSRFLLAGDQGQDGEAVIYDLEGGPPVTLAARGPAVAGLLDSTGELAITWPTRESYPEIGPVGGDRVYLLVPREPVRGAWVSTDRRWVVLVGRVGSTTLQLWPMPDLSRPPFHSLPHEKVLARLRELTNARVVRDSGSPSHWRLTHELFRGWEEPPTR